MDSVAPQNWNWAEFGLAGLVIAALFAILFYVHRQSREERKEMSDLHREERKQWQEASDKTLQGNNEVIRELKDAIKDLGRS